MKKLLKILLKIIGIVLAIIIFAIIFTIWIFPFFANTFFGDDIPPPDNRDLIPLEREIPEDQNAYFVLREYFSTENNQLIYNPISKEDFMNYSQGRGWDQEAVGEFLQNNAKARESISIVAKMDFF